MSFKNTQFLHTFLSLSFLLLPLLAFSQQEEGERSTAEILENFFRDTEASSESDAQFLLEHLDYLRENPLDLNRATEEDLRALGFLNALQIEQVLNYRKTLGNFLNIYELQAVPGFELADIQRLRYFIAVNTGTDTRSQSIWKGLYSGENELIMRWGRQIPSFYPSSSEGGPDIVSMRYRHSFDNRVSYGFTVDNDAGEAFFSGSNPNWFDFTSAHFFVKDANQVVKSLAIGDFSAIFGQGLLLQTGFAPGKSAESILVSRGGRTIRAYRSFGEAYFLRGAAATLGIGKNLEATLLYSNRNRDANIVFPSDTTDMEDPELAFTSLQYSGLHRTPSEIEDEKALNEQVAAARLSYEWTSGRIAFNGAYFKYDQPWQPTLAPYRQFVFTGSTLTAFSTDYEYHLRNFLFFGETARSQNGGMGTVNGVLFAPARPVTFSIVQRHYERDYQSIYAAPFGETSTPANESGVYLGMEVRPSKPWRINAYVDNWRHPWLRFGVDAPSRGWDYLLRVTYRPIRGATFYALWQSETKQRSDEIGDVAGLLDNQRNRFRLHAAYKVARGVELRSRVEWTQYAIEQYETAKGFVAYQEAVFKPLSGPISGAVRYTLFDTENFNTRVFTYENDLF
ncbi:MAG: helix-hairpin-helix domain-containing protein, partial [Saprospiraceae bacterium]